MEKIPVIIDCDPGHDDMMALVLAWGSGKLPSEEQQEPFAVSSPVWSHSSTRRMKKINVGICGKSEVWYFEH